jgi:hypothetical protein
MGKRHSACECAALLQLVRCESLQGTAGDVRTCPTARALSRLEDRQNDADAGVEEHSSCNAGDAYQGAFGVREVTDDKAVR